jgi:hypothetical protein
MEDTGTSVQDAPQTEEQIQQAEFKQQLDQAMNFNLNGVVPQETDTQAQVQGDEQKPTDPPVAATPVTFEVLKEKYGYDTPETAIKEIEELRAFKATPPAAEIKYENETSEKVAKALQAGKLKEVYQALDQQERLNELTSLQVDKDNAEKILKLAISIKNPTLSSHEVDFQYKNEYVVPKEPVQKTTEDEDDFNERHNEWKEKVEYIETKRVIAAKMAQPELELAKSKIIFPEVQSSVDEGYLQYKQSLEEQPKIDAAMREIYKPYTPKSIETKIRFTDNPNKVDFEFQHEPDVKAFEAAKEMALNSGKFLDLFKLPNGEFDNLGYLDAIYFAANKKAILTDAINQGKNAMIKASLPDNSGSGTQRQFPQNQDVSELDAAMQAAGVKRA